MIKQMTEETKFTTNPVCQARCAENFFGKNRSLRLKFLFEWNLCVLRISCLFIHAIFRVRKNRFASRICVDWSNCSCQVCESSIRTKLLGGSLVPTEVNRLKGEAACL